MDIKFYFQLFLRRLPYFLVFLVLGTAAGITIAKVLPPVYIAEAKLVVESEQIPSDLAQSTVTTGAAEALQRIQQEILTRGGLLEMANRFRIYDAPGSPDRTKMSADDVVTDLRKRVRIITTGGGTRGNVQATFVTVSFEAPNGALSAAVANHLVTEIKNKNAQFRINTTGQTLDFFEKVVKDLDNELKQLSAEILAFQNENLDALPDSLEFRRSQQAAAQERLVQLEREETVLRDRRARLVTLYESTGKIIPAADAAARQTPEAQRLAAARQELDSMLAVLSPQNPQVRMLQSRIDALEKTVTTQAATSAGATSEGVPNPQLSIYEINLADIDGQLAFLAEQKKQIRENMETLQASIEATPANAIRLDAMQRGFAATRARYDEAVANRAKAETGDTIETLSKGQRIIEIEPAVAPAAPDSPNRPVIAAAGVAGGLSLGIGIVLLLELLNSAVRRPADLQAKLGIVPFGTIPYIRTRGQIFRRRVVITVALLIVGLGVPAGLWFVHTEITPLDLLLDRVLDKLNIAMVGSAALIA